MSAWSKHHDRAAWYAWGRLDSGAAPVVGDDAARTVLRFSELYGTVHVSFDAGERIGAPGMVGAWDTFVATAGTAVTR